MPFRRLLSLIRMSEGKNTMLRLIIALCLVTTPILGQDFSENSKAKAWGLPAEHRARFKAKVVDMLCEIAGDCERECGKNRQLGLLRREDNVLIYPNKNNQPVFSSAVVDLLPYCGKQIDVDGLILDDPGFNLKNIYLVQKIRAEGDLKWVSATGWVDNWRKEHPGVKGKGSWFRLDPDINSRLMATGYLGLGETHQESWEAIN